MDPSNIDNTKTTGINPIVLESVQVLGRQVARNSATHRDLGFMGKLGKNWYAVWADTLWRDHGVTDAEQDTPAFHGVVRSSISLMTDDPLTVIDLHLNDDDPSHIHCHSFPTTLTGTRRLKLPAAVPASARLMRKRNLARYTTSW